MLKKLIILFSFFAIENSINCAEAQNAIGINYITEITPENLAQIIHTDTCGICLEELLPDTSNLYKSNCLEMLTHPHIFHRECILGWIRRRQPLAPSCPMCRGQMINFNLIEASKNGNLEAVRFLLDRGVDINARGDSGSTPLMLASFRGNLEIVKLLLDKGADINVRNDFGHTALTMISFRGNLEIVKLLLDGGANINAKTNSGRTALMLARQNGYQKIADLLIAHGAIDI